MKALPFVSMPFAPSGVVAEVRKLVLEPVLKDVFGLTDDEVARAVVDERTTQGAVTASHPNPPEISEYVFRAIRECRCFICVSWKPNRNVDLEHGYALGSGRPVFHFQKRSRGRDDATDLPFLLRNRPIHFYRSSLDLKRVLGEVLWQHFPPESLTPGQPLADFFGRCGLRIEVLEGDGRYAYGKGTISVQAETGEFTPPARWRKDFEKVRPVALREAKKNGEVLFDGRLARVVDYRPSRNEATGARSLQLLVQPTSYYVFRSTNYGFSRLPETRRAELVGEEWKNPKDLRGSRLANPLTVNLAVIGRYRGRDALIVQERNLAKVAHGKGAFHGSAAGMVSWDRDERAWGLDVFGAAENEIFEELGLRLESQEAITFSALVRERDYGEVGLIGEVTVDRDLEEAVSRRADAFEAVRFHPVSLALEDVIEFIQERGGFPAFTNLGLATLIFPLLRRGVPEWQIQSRLESVRDGRPR